MLRSFLKTIVLPPTSLVLLFLVGLVVGRRRRRLGRGIAAAALAASLLLTLPLVAALLMQAVQCSDPLDEAAVPKGAVIVILGGDVRPHAPELGAPTVGSMTLERIRYGAVLAHRLGLGVLVTGGTVHADAPAGGALMRDVLNDEFGVAVRYVEGRSDNTRENASMSAPILKADGVTHVVLVTHAWHLPRAVPEFEAAGFVVHAAPTAFAAPVELGLGAIVPSSRAFRDAALAIHELLGRSFYDWTR